MYLRNFFLLFGSTLFNCGCLADDFPQPLVFKPDLEDLRRVKVLWNPLLNVTKVFSIAQREVDYISDSGRIQPSAGQWISLVSESDQHNSNRRYVLVKKRPCQELQFNVTYQTGDGKVHSGVLQSVEPTAEPWPIDASVTVGEIVYNNSDRQAYMKVAYRVKSTGYRGVEPHIVMPFVQLNSCRTAFTEPYVVSSPIVTDRGRMVIVPLEYIKHQCELKIQLFFKVFVNESECFGIFASPQNQSLSVSLTCADVRGLKCPKAIQPCNASCEPEIIHSEPKFNYSQNLMIRSIWAFSKPGKAYIVRVTPAYTYQDNILLDTDPSEILTTNGTFVDLRPFSKLPESVYGMQVCALHSECSVAKLDWTSVPVYPVEFHQFLQLEPPTDPPTTVNNNSALAVSPTPLYVPRYKPQKIPKNNSNPPQALSVDQQAETQQKRDKTEERKHSGVATHYYFNSGITMVLLAFLL